MGRREGLAPLDDDAHGAPVGQSGKPAGQARIVLPRGAGPDQNGVVAGAQHVGRPARRLPGYPAAFAGPRRDPAVERGGELERDRRAALAYPGEKADQTFGRLVGAQARLDRDARRGQLLHPAAVHARVGIPAGDDGAGDAGLDQRVRARRGPADMGAGFQRDIGRGPPRGGSGAGERLRLRVRASARRRPSAPHRDAVAYDHAAHGWIRPGIAERASGDRNRAAHEAPVTLRLR